LTDPTVHLSLRKTMADVPVSALPLRQQKLLENARTALDIGNHGYALEACGQVLKASPGCVKARRVHRQAQLLQFEEHNRIIAKAVGGLSSTPFIFSSVTKDPLKALSSAERILSADPTSASALKMLAEAAEGLQMMETAVFAREAVQELEPDDAVNLRALAEARLKVGRPTEALAAADELIRLKPLDAGAQDLMRHAAIAQQQPAPQSSGPRAPATPPDPLDVAREELAHHLPLVEAEPDHLPHYRAIIAACRQLGRPGDALTWIRRARGRPAGATDAGLARTESEIEGEVLELQLKSAESALLGSPTDEQVQARVESARRELASFRLFEAKRNTDLNPHDHAMRLKLAQAYLDSGRADAALGHFQEALAAPEQRVAALIGMGRCHRARREFEAAVAQFILAKADLTKMDERKKLVVYSLGECYDALGREADAIAEYKAIYNDDTDYRDVAAKINEYFNRKLSGTKK
jgi:tetratricopeptide (TPR) repeat protein